MTSYLLASSSLVVETGNSTQLLIFQEQNIEIEQRFHQDTKVNFCFRSKHKFGSEVLSFNLH